MDKFNKVKANLEKHGYKVSVFADAKSAADYLDSVIDGKTVGIGGSATLNKLDIFKSLGTHNLVLWHWKQPTVEARKMAADAQVYLCSANAIAETGEIVNIDGYGNRVSSTLFGHEKLYIVAGRNKLAPDLEKAIWRARNIAAPKRAQQFKANTPCAVKADRCYDCKSPERICRGLVVLWGPAMSIETEVILIDEDLGL